MEIITRYNWVVRAFIAERLLALNRQFYTEHGHDFSATRRRLQPGVQRVLERLKGDESILDLGCGNGELARALIQRGHRGRYLGLDFSLPLLDEAKSLPTGPSVQFLQADLTSSAWPSDLRPSFFNIVFAFAVLHHIPGEELRLSVLQKVHVLLAPRGKFVHSNWHFLNSPRLKARIQPWNAIGLREDDIDPGDYLLDWKRGGTSLRYVHHFGKVELTELATASGFRVIETFSSDGENAKLGLYQTWEPARDYKWKSPP